MPGKFVDHSANERTFLAWVRTAISIVGFGLLIAHFGGAPDDRASILASLALVGLGVALILFSAIRFHQISQKIDSGAEEYAKPWHMERMPVLMAATLILLLIVFLVTVGWQ